MILLALVCTLGLPTGSGIAQTADYVPGEILVQFQSGYSGADFFRQVALEKRKPAILRHALIAEPLNIYRLETDISEEAVSETIRLLKQDPNVRHVQRNHYIHWRSNTPNDSLYPQQTYLQPSGSTPGFDIRAPGAWRITQGGVTPGGDTVVICVIDNGVDIKHPDLKGNLWVNQGEIPGNQKDDDGNGYIDDYAGWNVDFKTDEVSYVNFHGTPVAGLIGAVGNNRIGVTGINWTVRLMVVTSQIANVLSESRAIEAYTYPLVMRRLYNATRGKKGAFVVATNTSWGIDKRKAEEFPIWCQFYEALGEAGILNVAATINQSIDVDVVGDIPTTCPGDFILSATALSDKGELRYGFGKKSIDIAAPGFNLLTTAENGGYTRQSGNSFVSPQIAGAIGLLYASPCPTLSVLSRTDPGAAARMVRKALMEGVTPLDSLVGKISSGGMLNLEKSMRQLLDSCGKCPPLAKLEVKNLSTTAVKLSWVSNDSIRKLEVYHRAGSHADWISLPYAGDSLVMAGLQPCRNDVFSLRRYCQDANMPEIQLIPFQTDGCCRNPASLESLAITPTEASLRWEKVTATPAYFIRWRPIRDSLPENWLSIRVENPGILLRNLLPCTLYEVQVRGICATDTLAFGTTLRFRTTGCGNCLEKPYCLPRGITLVSAENEWIAQVRVGDFVNRSGKDGYGDYTRKEGLVLTPGKNYPLTLEPGYLNTSYDEFFIVWVDVNQDGSFTNEEELFNAGTAKKGAVNAILPMPLAARQGSTRMRVVMQYRQEPGACVFPVEFFGEVEDYCVTVTQPVPAVSLVPQADLKVFPNPGDGSFTVDFPMGHSWELLTIVNGLGQVVEHWRLPRESSLFRRQGRPLPSGTYQLLFRGPLGIYGHRLIVW